jgi:CheY-like chemotaxis protein
MGGDITIKSDPGQGSVFTAYIPATIRKSSVVIPESVEPVSDGHDNSRHTQTVLVIDDDPASHDLIRRILDKEGFNVKSAFNGTEGLIMAKTLRPDLITLDVMMPNTDGWKVLSDLKADSELCLIPVVMLTIVDDQKLGFALGASDYLTKPINRSHLSAVLNKYRKTPFSILIVEDDPIVRELLKVLLEKERVTVCCAENGLEGIRQLEKCVPSLILLDLIMPEMDGFQFVEEIWKNEAWRSVPVVVLTGKDMTEEDLARLNGHVEKIFQKQRYGENDLIQTVRKLVR